MAKLNKFTEQEIKEFKGQEHKGFAEGHEWQEQELATKAGQPLIDSAQGSKVVIRNFDFEWNKKMKPEDIALVKADKQSFFNNHARYIRDFLWKDGLSVLEHEDPKIMFTNKGYRIAVATQARFGVSIFEKATTLQNIMRPYAKLSKSKNKK